MRPRTILYTGKGGVGKTSVAAATARRCAAAGLRTIVLSTDPAHSLSDSFETALAGSPTQIGPNLSGQEVQAQEEIEHHWKAVSGWLGGLLSAQGVDRISAAEMTVPPGMDELFSLLQVKRHHESGEFDVIVVDCAPTGETLRLLSFPDVCTWWLERLFPRQRRWMAAARPFARDILDVPLPDGAVLEEIERLLRSLVAMNEILRDPARASVRLVMTPDRMVVREAMRTFTYLNLYGYLTDAVVVNRVLPAEAGAGYFAEWLRAQAEQLALVDSAFSPVPTLRAPHLPREVIGSEMLDELGDAVFAERPAHELLHRTLSQKLSSHNGTTTLRLALPFAERGDIDLRKVGLELIISVGGRRRTIILPAAMASYETRGARLRDGALEVAFEHPGDGGTAQHTH
ncbi:MAG: ArsA family ATPase [Thermoleophilaceae bacterium]